VNGKRRCLPLQFAATNGHLDVVKALVENGADWESSWNGHTAILQAEAYGHLAVRDYLQSLKPKHDPK
jgi:ankyrin repeat protein